MFANNRVKRVKRYYPEVSRLEDRKLLTSSLQLVSNYSAGVVWDQTIMLRGQIHLDYANESILSQIPTFADNSGSGAIGANFANPVIVGHEFGSNHTLPQYPSNIDQTQWNLDWGDGSQPIDMTLQSPYLSWYDEYDQTHSPNDPYAIAGTVRSVNYPIIMSSAGPSQWAGILPTVPDHTYTQNGEYDLTLTDLSDGGTFAWKVTVGPGTPGKLMYDATGVSSANAQDLMTVTNVTNSVVGSQFSSWVVPAKDEQGNTKTISNVAWTIPDGIAGQEWGSVTGFNTTWFQNGTSSIGGVTPFWGHGNPSALPTPVPATEMGGVDWQKIEADVTYADGSTEVLRGAAPVYVPQVTYAVAYSNVTYDHPTMYPPGIMALHAGDTFGDGAQGYNSDTSIDVASTKGYGGTFGLIQTAYAYTTRTWIDSSGVDHEERTWLPLDFSDRNGPFLDVRGSDPTVLMDIRSVGTVLNHIDSPLTGVDAGFTQYVMNDQWYETVMYAPSSSPGTNSVYVPLSYGRWGFIAMLYNDDPTGNGGSYHLGFTRGAMSYETMHSSGVYPTWIYNMASDAKQVSRFFLETSRYADPFGTIGPHDPTWLSTQLDSPTTELVASTVVSVSDVPVHHPAIFKVDGVDGRNPYLVNLDKATRFFVDHPTDNRIRGTLQSIESLVRDLLQA